MAIYVDVPLWPWHDRLWSHLISDESLDELHDFARVAGLRYLSFGFDHYDVPDVLFDHVQNLGAVVVDARDIVRMLRRAGLRTARGKSAKRWTWLPGGVPALAASGIAPDLADRVEQFVGAEPGSAEALHRPGETALVVSGPTAPDQRAVAAMKANLDAGLLLVTSEGPWGWAIELVSGTARVG